MFMENLRVTLLSYVVVSRILGEEKWRQLRNSCLTSSKSKAFITRLSLIG